MRDSRPRWLGPCAVGTAYCLDGQVYTASSAIRWLCELGLLDSPEAIDSTAAPDSGGVLCVPALAGLGAPWWRPEATATFAGMTLATGRGHLVRAVVEGIAAQVAEVATTVATDLGRPVSPLRVDGGLAQSATVLQAVADLLQVPVEVYPSPHATALGSAALGRMALDAGLAVDSAVPAWSPATVVEPRWSQGRAAEHLGRWRTVLGATAGRAVDGEAAPDG